MAYISYSVGKGGKNLVPDVKIIQWMLSRAQTNYSSVVFGACHNISETGNLDIATDSAIKALIAYRERVTPKVFPSPIGGNQLEATQIFKKSIIAPDDDDYKYLLKCTLKPVCLTPDGLARMGFHTDSLVSQGFAGRISFEVFKNAVIAKDNDSCLDSTATEAKKNPYYTIDSGIILEADAILVLNKIAPLYFNKVGKKFNVNSGTRTADRQAEAMYTVYTSGDRTLHLYRNRKVANELIDIIRKGRSARKSKTEIVQKMTTLIQNNASRGIFMSSHQRAGAIDISVRGDVGVPAMTGSEQKIMTSIATKITGFKAIIEKYPPHIHLKFK